MEMQLDDWKAQSTEKVLDDRLDMVLAQSTEKSVGWKVGNGVGAIDGNLVG